MNQRNSPATRTLTWGGAAVTVTALTFGVAGALQAAGTQQASSAAPSFTAAQVVMGERVYAQSCAGCHGADLQEGRAPDLVGEEFLAEWADGERPAHDLYQYIAEKMPRNKPGSLTEQQYLNVTAFVLAENGYDTGRRTLTPARLKQPLAAPDQ